MIITKYQSCYMLYHCITSPNLNPFLFRYSMSGRIPLMHEKSKSHITDHHVQYATEWTYLGNLSISGTILPFSSLWSAQQSFQTMNASKKSKHIISVHNYSNWNTQFRNWNTVLTIKINVRVPSVSHSIGFHCISNLHDLLCITIITTTSVK